MTENRQREDRNDEELRARQARIESTIDGAKNLKLAIPDEIQKQLDDEGRIGRWVVEDATRMAELTDPRHGYRPVNGVKPVSTRDLNGEPIKLKLMSKRKDFLVLDERERDALRREKEAAALAASDAGPGFYADEANSFSRGKG